jgi:hypothetical protein
LRPHCKNDFVVVIAGTNKSLARIMGETRSDFKKVWGWSIYGFNAAGISGQCDTLEEAKAEAKAEVLRMLETGTPIMSDPPEWRPGSACL